MEKILVIDNYDSFTYNLVHLIKELTDKPIDVYRNDQITIEEVDKYDTIVLSPGPGIPDEAGRLKEIIKEYAPTKKILGVCLGQQAIGEVFGSKLKNLDDVFHGVETPMTLTKNSGSLFTGLNKTFPAGRYHSWVIDKETLSDDLEITCTDEYDEIMGIQHKTYKVYAIQFHPESVLTPDGETMISNFLFNC
jgi:anthranilate synthase component 2